MKFTFKNLDIVLFFSNHGDTDNLGKKGKGRRISLSSSKPGLQSELQGSQGYTVSPCLGRPK